MNTVIMMSYNLISSSQRRGFFASISEKFLFFPNAKLYIFTKYSQYTENELIFIHQNAKYQEQYHVVLQLSQHQLPPETQCKYWAYALDIPHVISPPGRPKIS